MRICGSCAAMWARSGKTRHASMNECCSSTGGSRVWRSVSTRNSPAGPRASLRARQVRWPGGVRTDENPCASGRHRRRRHRLQRALPLGERGLERLSAHRTQRADLGIDVARGRRHHRARRERDDDLVAQVLVRTLSEARSGDRPVVRLPSRGRRDARAHRAAHGGAGAVPLEGAPSGVRSALARQGGDERARAHPRSLRREGRDVRSEPRARRSERRHPRIREGGTRPWRRDRASLLGAGDPSAPRRHVGGGDDAGRRRRRARGERGGAVGARGGGARRGPAAADAGRASLHRHRADPRDRGDGSRASAHRRRRCGVLHAPGRTGPAARSLRVALHALGGRRDPARFRSRASARRPRAHGAQHGAGGGERAGARAGGGQAGGQRPDDLLPGPQPAHRPLAGVAQLLVRMRGDDRVQSGRRGRQGADRVDGERRSGTRFLHVGCGPLRRLGRPRVHHGTHRGHVLHALSDPLPLRRARGGASGAHHTRSIRC